MSISTHFEGEFDPNYPLCDSDAYELCHRIRQGEEPPHEWLVKLANWAEEKDDQLRALKEQQKGRAA